MTDPVAFDRAYFQGLGGSTTKRLRARYWRRRLVPQGGLLMNVGSGVAGPTDSGTVSTISVDVSMWALRQASGSRVCADASALPFHSDRFDGAMAFDVLEHLVDPRLALGELCRIIRPGACISISVPNSDGLSARVASRGRDSRPWVADTDESHVSLLSRSEWLSVIERAGLQVVRVGTDTPWAAPYGRRLPRVQVWVSKVVAVVANLMSPMLPWTVGENLIVLARRPYERSRRFDHGIAIR